MEYLNIFYLIVAFFFTLIPSFPFSVDGLAASSINETVNTLALLNSCSYHKVFPHVFLVGAKYSLFEDSFDELK